MDAILNFLWAIISFYNFLLIRIVVVLVMMLLTAAYLVYFERKISAWAQKNLAQIELPGRIVNHLQMCLNFYLKDIVRM
jgi:NADH:ubiquinone oxidoreductase subunit H